MFLFFRAPRRRALVLRVPLAVRARRLARTVATEVCVGLAVALFLAAVVPRAVVVQIMPSSGTPVCGTAQLNSPFSYNGATGSYSSGTAGLPTFGSAGTNFPSATAGIVLATGTSTLTAAANTVYYFLPGGSYNYAITAATNDAFVGGYTGGAGGAIMDGGYTVNRYAFVTPGTDQTGVTIEYLTIRHYTPQYNNAAVNQAASDAWTVQFDTITQNVPGEGLIAQSGSITKNDCITQNGEAGMTSGVGNGYEPDSLTGGAYAVTVENNEIANNATCDYYGTITNSSAGYYNYNPVPSAMQNPNCTIYGAIPVSAGVAAGYKFVFTNGVIVETNWIHDNYGAGGWADTDNANTTWAGNTITGNVGPGIDEEISYNFSVTLNILTGNDVLGGIGNPGFPDPAVYISQSGSDSIFSGIPACSEPACAGFPSYTSQSQISHNTFTNNGGGVFLWADPTRYCHTGNGEISNACPLAVPATFTASACSTNFPGATVNTSTYAGNTTGSPAENWWDGCQWENENIAVAGNTIINIPSQIKACNATAWPSCGVNGVFTYAPGTVPNSGPIWGLASAITFWRGNAWSGNIYVGSSPFWVWTPQNTHPITVAQWTGATSGGDKCNGSGETSTLVCAGPFGQDAGAQFIPSWTTGHTGTWKRW